MIPKSCRLFGQDCATNKETRARFKMNGSRSEHGGRSDGSDRGPHPNSVSMETEFAPIRSFWSHFQRRTGPFAGKCLSCFRRRRAPIPGSGPRAGFAGECCLLVAFSTANRFPLRRKTLLAGRVFDGEPVLPPDQVRGQASPENASCWSRFRRRTDPTPGSGPRAGFAGKCFLLVAFSAANRFPLRRRMLLAGRVFDGEPVPTSPENADGVPPCSICRPKN